MGELAGVGVWGGGGGGGGGSWFGGPPRGGGRGGGGGGGAAGGGPEYLRGGPRPGSVGGVYGFLAAVGSLVAGNGLLAGELLSAQLRAGAGPPLVA